MVAMSEARAAARQWYEREIARIAARHGHHWPTHKEWIDDYLRSEYRALILKKEVR